MVGAFLAFTLSGHVGCDQSEAKTLAALGRTLVPADGSSADAEHIEDLGFLLENEGNYVCWPLERLGVAPDAQVTRIGSSCDCVNAQVIIVNAPRGPKSALRIDFIPESTLISDEAMQPVSLAVELQLHLADGTRCIVVLRFIEGISRPQSATTEIASRIGFGDSQ